jgi:hypothetical protein
VWPSNDGSFHMTATRISTVRKIGLTLSLALSMSTLATSASLAYSARAREMCMGDAYRLCSAEIPNISRIIACMRRNKSNLSPGCRSVMDQENTAATKPKPVQAAPVEHKPIAAQPAQSTAGDTKPVQTAPVERTLTTAPAVEPSAVTDAKPPQTAPVEQAPTTARPVEQPAVADTPVEQKPTIAPPVEQRVDQAKPSQAPPSEQKAGTAVLVEKPVEARPDSRLDSRLASRATPPNQRKPKHPQMAAARHVRYGFRSFGPTFGFAIPIPLVIPFYW